MRSTACGPTSARTAGMSICSRSTATSSGLQFAGSCKSCPSSSVTLELAVEDAVRAAAPEISSIEVVTGTDAESKAAPAVIPADNLMSRVRTQPQGHVWHPVPDVAELTPGEVGGFAVAGTTVLACRVGDQLFAYRDRCGSCGESLAGAALHRRMGSAINDAVLRCPRCHAHFDVVHAGACVDGNGSAEKHLEPIPLLERDGVLSMAVARGGGIVTGAMTFWRASAPHGILRSRKASGARCARRQISDEHQHVVNVEGRQLMCVCRGCYLLFTDTHAELRYRAVPDRYLSFPEFALGRREWQLLQIPVGLAFFFRNSSLDRMVAFYPGPAGATESELDLSAWNGIRAADPRVDMLADDTEALIVRVPDDEQQPPECHLVPIDACYEFVGRLRMLWHGFDGGQHVREFVDEFFDHVASRGKAVQP